MLRISPKVYHGFIRAMEQQLWFWGQDVLYPQGNLLTQYGFQRISPRFHGGSSRYKLSWEGRVVELHSYCVGIYGGARDGFIFIRSQDRAYQYRGQISPMPGRYAEKRLILPKDSHTASSFHDASLSFLNWLEDYETWVDQVCGTGYREGCFNRYHRKWLPIDKMRAWFLLFKANPEQAEAVIDGWKKNAKKITMRAA